MLHHCPTLSEPREQSRPGLANSKAIASLLSTSPTICRSPDNLLLPAAQISYRHNLQRSTTSFRTKMSAQNASSAASGASNSDLASASASSPEIDWDSYTSNAARPTGQPASGDPTDPAGDLGASALSSDVSSALDPDGLGISGDNSTDFVDGGSNAPPDATDTAGSE